MKHRLIVLILLLSLVIAAGSAMAADREVRLHARHFTPTSLDVDAALSQFSGRHAFVQFDRLPNAATRDQLAARGLRLLRSVGGNAYIAAVAAEVSLPKSDRATLRWVGEIRASDKLHTAVREGRFAPHSDAGFGRRMVDVGFHLDVGRTAAERVLADFDAEQHDYATLTNSFIVTLDAAEIENLAARDQVVWVAEAGPALAPMMNTARVTTGADIAQEPPYSVSGAGVKAFVLDGGSPATGANAHPDLAGRVTTSGFSMPDIIGHATHVSCTIAGDGTASDGFWRGMAPEAEIISTTILPIPTLPPLYNQPGNMESAYRDAIAAGASVSNNSIGSNISQLGSIFCDKEGDYERTAQLIDGIIGEAFGRITIVWANGNERGNNDGACGNAYYTTAPPATAKNSITVGAVNKEDQSMTPFSSWGPTDDGRMRPDISAPGCSVTGGLVSCSGPFSGPDTDYMSMCGTSMASPVVTGSVALAQEYWRRQIGGEDAWASTMKALFIHGATELGQPGPDYQYGFGGLDVPATLDLIDGALIVEESLDQGGEYRLQLEPTGDPIKVTLAWTDVAGSLLAERTLVNDLDLTLVAADGTILPWTLDPANPGDLATRAVNERDPVEQITFDLDGKAPVEIVVTAAGVPEGPQRFSLVITGLEDAAPGDDDSAGDDDSGDDDSGDDDATGGNPADDDDDDNDGGGCGC